MLQSLTGLSDTAPVPASPRQTTPLKQPEALLDNFALPSAKRNDLPAQLPGISSLTTPAPASSARLSETEAELLLDVSARLASTREQEPIKFQTIMSALQQLGTDASGQADFASLSPQQQQALAELGMTPQNTSVIFQQLYQLLLPGSQQNTSDAFKSVQAQVTGFISNLDLRERTMTQIQQEAKDLTSVQGVVSTLSANSIQALLADQTASVFDLGFSQITKDNFNMSLGMDYTLGHMLVLSQQSPATLQTVEGLINKVKQEQTLDSNEQNILRNYGLNINSQNKLETMDGNTLDFKAVGELEDVIFKLKDPSAGFSKVLQASANVIAKSGKLEELALLAQKQAKGVQQTTQLVAAGTVNVEQLRQSTNQLNAQLTFAHLKAENIADAMDAATGLFGAINLSPEILQQWNIQIVQGPHTQRFFKEGKEVSRMEIMQSLGQLLEQQRSEINGMAGELARKKTETLLANVSLNQNTQKLEVQKTELQATEAAIVVAKADLHQAQAEYDLIVAEEKPGLKPEELTLLETKIEPAVKKHVETAVAESDKALEVIKVTVAEAETVIARSKAVQQAVLDDAQIWEDQIKKSEALVKRLDNQIESLNEIIKKEQQQDPLKAPRPAAQELPAEEALQTKQETVALTESDADAQDAETQAHVRRSEQQRSQHRNEAIYLENTQREKVFTEGLRQQQQTRQRAKKDQEQLAAEVKDLQK